ncbi:hypothetical protein BDA96_07G007600 [Sorghum bicolor]|uniref:Secreted protein n=1 Tax=Sorghum bicolor TaxID=4558 RepID=A0A921QHQ1_SORBI|nr:hypothetical protein BDA96_07G007600 [Sorghum bicolor]
MTGIQVLLAPPRPLLAFVRLPVVVLSTSPALLMRHHPAPTILCVLLFANQSDDDERPWIYSKEKQPQTRSRAAAGVPSVIKSPLSCTWLRCLSLPFHTLSHEDADL